MKNGKLELTWVGKNERLKIEPRILLNDSSKSYGDKKSDNMLIFGDNLLALKALEQDYSSRIKCVFIDPPYNTGAAFAQYDDGLEHSIWLSLMRDRLELLWGLLEKNGTIWITIDDNEGHYLKVLCDELFGRHSYVGSIAWEKDKGRRSDTDISSAHDTILIYAKNRDGFKAIRNLLSRTKEQESRYRNPDDDPRGPWLQGDNGTAKSGTEKSRFPITTPSGKVVLPPPGRYWVFSKESFSIALKEGRVYFGKKGDGMPIVKRYLSEVQSGVVPRSWWPADEVGTNQDAKRDHLNKLLPDIEPFATPKPEQLLHRIIHIATNPGDIVLDSFAGSGTTGATAHKMGRKWIMCEMGEHCHTHIIPRLQKLINGEDSGGISSDVGWKGGGGFKYYRLAESLLVRDAELSTKDHPVFIINPRYDAEMLIRAICKVENFKYRNEGRLHGMSSEKRFLHVTTNLVTQEYLDSLAADIASDQSLLLYCTRSIRGLKLSANIEIKRIPRDLLAKCDFEEGK